VGASQAGICDPYKAVARALYGSERFFQAQRNPLLSYVIYIHKYYYKAVRQAAGGYTLVLCTRTVSAGAVLQQ